MRIDAHQHFWRLADRAGGWPPPELAAIHRDFLPEDLAPLLAAAGIDGTVLVQTMETAADTAFMLDLAGRHGFIMGVVGWTDLKAPGAAGEIAALARDAKPRGFRPMLQEIADPAWIDDAALAPAVAAMLREGLVFDALVKPPHLPALTAFARRHPDLPIVIDHGAKPEIAAGVIAPWRAAMAELAGLPNVRCKISGLVTEAGDLPMAATAPYVAALLEMFGPSRLIWGSDWPVLRLAGDYADWVAFCRDLIPAEHHAAVFGGNAFEFYGLGACASEASGETC